MVTTLLRLGNSFFYCGNFRLGQVSIFRKLSPHTPRYSIHLPTNPVTHSASLPLSQFLQHTKCCLTLFLYPYHLAYYLYWSRCFYLLFITNCVKIFKRRYYLMLLKMWWETFKLLMGMKSISFWKATGIETLKIIIYSDLRMLFESILLEMTANISL